jgi:hypothetical protein
MRTKERSLFRRATGRRPAACSPRGIRRLARGLVTSRSSVLYVYVRVFFRFHSGYSCVFAPGFLRVPTRRACSIASTQDLLVRPCSLYNTTCTHLPPPLTTRLSLAPLHPPSRTTSYFVDTDCHYALGHHRPQGCDRASLARGIVRSHGWLSLADVARLLCEYHGWPCARRRA